MNDQTNPLDYHKLVDDLLDGVITESEFEQLNLRLAQDRGLLELYYQKIILSYGLKKHSRTMLSIAHLDTGPDGEAEAIIEVVEKDLEDTCIRKALLLLQEGPVCPEDQPASAIRASRRRPSRQTVMMACYKMAAVVAICLSIIWLDRILFQAPSKTLRSVAVLSDALDARWLSGSVNYNPGDKIFPGQLKLESGLAKFQYPDGTEVVVEGPANFSLAAPDRLELNYGAAYTRVSHGTLNFIVKTPNTRVVDLGTEFAVEANPDGSSEVHVIKGRVLLAAGLHKSGQKIQELLAGQARLINALDHHITVIALNRDKYARDIHSQNSFVWRGQSISLASIVSGGNGFEPGNTLGGIDPGTGAITPRQMLKGRRPQNPGYLSVSGNPFIDGVFVPNGSVPGQIVSSARHEYNAFPPTANTYYADISANVEMSAGDDREYYFVNRSSFSLSLKDPADGQPSSCLVMHANSGITFDLDKIRASLGHADLTFFSATCGVSYNMDSNTKAGFWVLLDGQKVFYHQVDQSRRNPAAIRIPIRNDQRFLTIAATDGGDNISYDCCLFEEPMLDYDFK